MKTSKALQYTVAAALALALNGVAAAQSMHLNTSATRSVAATAVAPDLPFKAGSVGTTSQPSFGNYGHGGYGWKVPQCAPVPEPSTYLLMLAGVGLIGFMSYRRQRYFSSTDSVLSSA